MCSIKDYFWSAMYKPEHHSYNNVNVVMFSANCQQRQKEE